MKRETAITLGLPYYSTGKPCKRGHVTSRRTSNGHCALCAKARKATEDYKIKARVAANKRRLDVTKKPMLRAKSRRMYVNNAAAYMLHNAKLRAKQLNVPFSLQPCHIRIPETCPVLGIPLFRGVGKSGPNSPSLDRIYPAKGYTATNVAVISQRANQIKNDASCVELRAVLRWLEQYE